MKEAVAILDKVVVQPEDPEKVTAGGIYIPETHEKKPTVGDVTSIGPKVTEVMVGDKVMFGRYSGTKFSLDDIEYVSMLEEDVLFIIRDAPEEQQAEPPDDWSQTNTSPDPIHPEEYETNSS